MMFTFPHSRIALAMFCALATSASPTFAYSFTHDFAMNETKDYQEFWEDFQYGTSIGNVLISTVRRESQTYNDATTHLETQGGTLIHSGVIQDNATDTLSISTTNTVTLHIANTRTIGNVAGIGPNWLIDSGVGEKSFEFDPSQTLENTLLLTVEKIGMSATGGTAINAGRITLGLDYNASMETITSFTFSTDNIQPSPEEVKDFLNNNFTPLSWDIKPIVTTTSKIAGTIQAIGIQVHDTPRQSAIGINRGNITLSGRFDITESYTQENIKTNGFSRVPILKPGTKEELAHIALDTSNIQSNNVVDLHASLIGMAAASGRAQATPLRDSTRRHPWQGSVLLRNYGDITLVGNDQFFGYGMALVIQNDGKALARNYGKIHLEQIGSHKSNQSHALYVEFAGNNATFTLGDWRIDLENVQDKTPIAYYVVAGTPTIQIDPNATLFVAPTQSDNLDVLITLPELFGYYTRGENDVTFTPSHTLGSGRHNTFSHYGTGSEFVTVDTIADTNQAITLAFDVHPEKSFGAQAQATLLTHQILSHLQTKAMISPAFATHEGWQWQVRPWYAHENIDIARPVRVDGDGLFIEGLWHQNAWSASFYGAYGNEDLKSQRLTSDLERWTLGGNIRYQYHPEWSIGLTMQWQHNQGDWFASNRFGQAQTELTSQDYYIAIEQAYQTTVAQHHQWQASYSLGWFTQRFEAYDWTDPALSAINYRPENYQSFLLELKGSYRGQWEIDGYTVGPFVSIGGLWLENDQQRTALTYLAHNYRAKHSLDSFYAHATVGIGMQKDQWSLALYTTQLWSRHANQSQLQGQLTWSF